MELSTKLTVIDPKRTFKTGMRTGIKSTRITIGILLISNAVAASAALTSRPASVSQVQFIQKFIEAAKEGKRKGIEQLTLPSIRSCVKKYDDMYYQTTLKVVRRIPNKTETNNFQDIVDTKELAKALNWVWQEYPTHRLYINYKVSEEHFSSRAVGIYVKENKGKWYWVRPCTMN